MRRTHLKFNLRRFMTISCRKLALQHWNLGRKIKWPVFVKCYFLWHANMSMVKYSVSYFWNSVKKEGNFKHFLWFLDWTLLKNSCVWYLKNKHGLPTWNYAWFNICKKGSNIPKKFKILKTFRHEKIQKFIFPLYFYWNKLICNDGYISEISLGCKLQNMPFGSCMPWLIT